MTSKMIFLNICISVIVFSLFLLLFLKPRTGSQFEIIQSTTKPVVSTPSKEIATPKVTSQITPQVTPKPTSNK